MVEKQSAGNEEPLRNDAGSRAAQAASAEHATKTSQADPSSELNPLAACTGRRHYGLGTERLKP
jgi:hypothetical protein